MSNEAAGFDPAIPEQSANRPPDSYPDRTHTGRRRRASDQVATAGRSPPDHWAHRLPYLPPGAGQQSSDLGRSGVWLPHILSWAGL